MYVFLLLVTGCSISGDDTTVGMATEKGVVEKDIPDNEVMSEPDAADTVNPLYSFTSSKSDHLSLGRQRAAAVPAADQSAGESARVLRSATNIKPPDDKDDTGVATQPSDDGKTGVSSSGSLPLISTLNISRPSQSPAASEELQQPAAAKIQPPPPPVVPIRLVRAPSSARPATNIPQVNCPEKIVSSLKYTVRRFLWVIRIKAEWMRPWMMGMFECSLEISQTQENKCKNELSVTLVIVHARWALCVQ